MNTSFSVNVVSVRRRAAVLALAAVCSLSLMSALLVTFDHAGPQRWLADSPSVQMAMAQCPAPAAREARQACLQGIVARRVGDGALPPAVAMAGR